MTRRTKVIVRVLLVLALAIGWPVGAHYRAKWRVERYKRLLQAGGEKLATAELVPPAQDNGENGVPALLAALRRIGSFPYGNTLPAMRYVVPGHALVASKQPALPMETSSNVWPALHEVIGDAQGDLADLRAALERPILAFHLDYSQTANLPLGHLTQLKTAAQWLSAAAILELRDGRATAALENLNALLRLAVHYRGEPSRAAELTRVAVGQMALDATWEALQRADLPEDRLAQLQASWESLEWMTQAETALAMNRAMDDLAFAASRESFSDLNAQRGGLIAAGQGSGLDDLAAIGRDLLNDPAQGLKDIAHRYPGYWSWKWWWSYDDELVNLQFLQAAIEAVRTAHREDVIGPALKQYDAAIVQIQQAHPSAGRWLEDLASAQRMTRNFLTRMAEPELERHLVIAAVALKRYQIRHGQYPPTLAALAPQFLRATPRDAMDGQPLRYRLEPDGSFSLYSVGADGQDDGGDPTPTESPTSRRQYWRGRDAVWPQPASAEEFKVFEATLRNPRRRGWLPPRTVATNGMSAPILKELELLGGRYNLVLTNGAPAARTE